MGAIHGLIIYNGLSRWPLSDGLTCFPHGGGSSTVDYILGSPTFTHHISDFTIPPPPLSADHTYLSFRLSTCHIPPPPPSPSPTTYFQIHFDHDLDTIYNDILSTALHDIHRFPTLEAKATFLTTAIHEAARQSFPYTIRSTAPPPVGTVPRNAWYDNECKAYRLTLMRDRESGLISVSQAQRLSRQLIRRKKRAFLAKNEEDMIRLLLSNDSKEFWKTLSERKSPTPITNPLTWSQYAQRLYDIPDQPPSDISHMPRPSSASVFTIANVRDAIRKLHNGRAKDHEGLQTEYLAHGWSTLAPILAPLFNEALCNGFPQAWTMHTIIPIHKGGDPMDPNNYRMIMIGHVLAKVYGAVLESEISSLAERHGQRAGGQAGFRRGFSTLDHIFTLRAIIEEAGSRSQKVYCSFVDFRKAFDTVPRSRLFRRLQDLQIPYEMIWGVLALYESVAGRVRTPEGLSDVITSTIGVKQGCPLSPSLFGLYIDEVSDFIDRLGGEGSLLAQTLVPILLYADDIVLISSSPEGLQRHLDALQVFCEQRDLTVNLGKTKVMIFHTSRPAMGRHTFTFRGESVEIVSSYVYLGVLFSGPRFSMVPAAQARLGKGYASLARLERQCFQSHFQDPQTKGLLFDSMVRPAAMYGAPLWGGDLSATDWRCMERLQILMFSRLIRSKPSVPHQIILAEFGAAPLQLDAALQTITYIQRVQLMDTRRLPRLALTSSTLLATQGTSKCWYMRITRWFTSLGLQMDRLPPFQFSPDAPTLRLSRQDLNRIIRLDLTQLHTQRTWLDPQELPTKLHFYREHFLQMSQDGFIQRPAYIQTHLSHAMRIAIGQLRVSSHRLQIEAGRAAGIQREHRLCQLCTMREVESEDHYLFRCPVYYEIRGRYHCLFREGFRSLSRIMGFLDQRCLGLFLLELRRHRDRLSRTRGAPRTDRLQHCITSFFPTERGNDGEDRRRQRDDDLATDRRVRRRPVSSTMQVMPIQALLVDAPRRPIGVRLDAALRVTVTRRPRPRTRQRPTGRQLQVHEMLQRHQTAPWPHIDLSAALLDIGSTFATDV